MMCLGAIAAVALLCWQGPLLLAAIECHSFHSVPSICLLPGQAEQVCSVCGKMRK